MQLVLNTPGTHIGKAGECFKIKTNSEQKEISANKVEQILITSAVGLTSDAVELAVENNIDIIFLKRSGQPLGRVWHSKLGRVSTIRRRQLYLQENKLGVRLVSEWLTRKLDNQEKFLTKLGKNRRDERKEYLKECVSKISMQRKELQKLCEEAQSIDSIRLNLQGHEGTAGRIYFEALSNLLPSKYQFEGRSKNPALDYFNCMLNYGYGILYGKVEKACIIAGLDPYIGIMHTDNYNRKAFIFDLIEQYRTIVDEVVFKLFSNRKIKEEYFDSLEKGYYLNTGGKQVLIAAFNEVMEKKVRYSNRNIELGNIIQYDCHKLANVILKGE